MYPRQNHKIILSVPQYLDVDLNLVPKLFWDHIYGSVLFLLKKSLKVSSRLLIWQITNSHCKYYHRYHSNCENQSHLHVELFSIWQFSLLFHSSKHSDEAMTFFKKQLIFFHPDSNFDLLQHSSCLVRCVLFCEKDSSCFIHSRSNSPVSVRIVSENNSFKNTLMKRMKDKIPEMSRAMSFRIQHIVFYWTSLYIHSSKLLRKSCVARSPSAVLCSRLTIKTLEKRVKYIRS